MKWVVLAIVLFIAGSTLVNLYFRKPGRGHQPYEEARRRVTAARLQKAGWERLPVDTRRPAEPPPPGGNASVSRGALGLGLDLEACFTERPPLLASIDRVSAPVAVARGADYAAYFTASLSDQRMQLGEIQLFRSGNDLVLVPRVEPLPGPRLLSRWRDTTYCTSFPTQALPPGRYRVRVVANGPAAVWSLTVK
jgi:hypothetical protein